MKTLVAIILALGIGFAGAYVVVSKQKDAQLAKLKAGSQTPVTESAPKTMEKVITVSAPSAPAEESPQNILNDLLDVKLGTGSERNAELRMVVFKLEMLMQRGAPAIPAIRAFLGRNVDVNYNQQNNQNDNQPQANGGNPGNGQNNNGTNNNNRGFNRGGGFGGFGGFAGGRGGGARRARNIENLRTDWVVPPSLRLGLIGILKEIGGPDAEQALAEVLATTGRGVEVAYLTVILEEIAPEKYRNAALSAAKDLLMTPPPVEDPDRLDDLAKSYLYGVLEFYKDTSFAVNAQQMLVGADGRLDQDAMDYLSDVMKDQSVSALYAAYQNPALTNQFDKMMLGRDILNYVGQNSQANQMFTETLNNPDLNERMKAMVIIQQAGGGFGPFASEAPTDPQVIASKIQVLNSLQSQFADNQELSQAITLATQALQNGQPIQPEDLRAIMGGGRGGPGGNNNRRRGNRGGGGDGGE